jgi:hypothetical protein
MISIMPASDDAQYSTSPSQRRKGDRLEEHRPEPVLGSRRCRVHETGRHAQLRSTRPAASIGRTRKAKASAGRPPRTRSHSTEHRAQIVCGHFGDNRTRESYGLCRRGDRFEVSQTPGWIAIAKAPVECLVAGRRCEAFALVRTVEIERRRLRRAINPSVASQGEMWIMLMQIIPSADAIGQTGLDASGRSVRTFLTPTPPGQAAILSRAFGSGWRAGKQEELSRIRLVDQRMVV